MMKVLVDATKCGRRGECVMAASDVFEIGEDDVESVTVLNPEPGEKLRNAVEEAALMCPVAAIRIED